MIPAYERAPEMQSSMNKKYLPIAVPKAFTVCQRFKLEQALFDAQLVGPETADQRAGHSSAHAQGFAHHGDVGHRVVAAGMGATAFVAFLMASCDKRYTVAQFALFTSLSSLLAHTLGAGAGYVVDDIGWALGFVATIFVALPALVLIRWLPASLPTSDHA